jgi:NADPH-dependent curcumin reductase CurA
MLRNNKIILHSRPTGLPERENFSLVSDPLPIPGEGEVLVRIDLISLDPAMRGWMNEGTTYISGVGLGEVMRAFSAGQVVESKDPAFKKGDWVSGLLGVQAFASEKGDYLSALDLSLGPIEEHLGVLGMPGMTAYFGLLERGKPAPGNTLLVLGASGIVGMTVGQIGRIMGCRVIGTAGSPEKGQFLKEICGFDEVILYKTEKISARLKECCPGGVDILFDNVGGSALDSGLAALARGSRVVICGAISQYNETSFSGPRNYMKIVTARATMSGIIVFDFQSRYPEAISTLSQWLKEGKLLTRSDIYEGLENFPNTLNKLFKGENFGKLLLRVNHDEAHF